jgi:hypothetical protein
MERATAAGITWGDRGSTRKDHSSDIRAHRQGSVHADPGTSRLAPHPPGSAQRVGMAPSEGAALAQRQGHHGEVAYADITLEL